MRLRRPGGGAAQQFRMANGKAELFCTPTGKALEPRTTSITRNDTKQDRRIERYCVSNFREIRLPLHHYGGIIRTTWNVSGYFILIAIDAIGPSRFAELARRCGVPAVAIGGITGDRVAEVMSAGASGVAVISALFGASDPTLAARAIRSALDASGR